MRWLQTEKLQHAVFFIKHNERLDLANKTPKEKLLKVFPRSYSFKSFESKRIKIKENIFSNKNTH